MEGDGRRWKISVLGLIFLGIAQLCDAGVGYREDAFVGYSEQSYKKTTPPGTKQASEYLIFSTTFGEIKVELASIASPKSVKYIKSLVSRGLTEDCSFYRAEPAGPTLDEGRDLVRPGYALVQGGLYSCGRQETKNLAVETALRNTKGAISLITGTSEFFFNLEAHPDWDGSFSVFGRVVGSESWNTLLRIVRSPTRQEAHTSGTILRMLINPVPFRARLTVSGSYF
ncbi:hypothetical protein R1flu_007367 [Riccia fluitans]|uniref:PPIase cyclophilin-type domain-containing protein n=1 Tax=Riccia fluitans TaxID=41844 RepID=A0ABD1YZG6_9MARC